VFLRAPVATIGAISYLLAFVGAFLYPYISHQTFAALPAVALAWPWIDHLPRSTKIMLIACALLNAAIIYTVIALLSFLLNRILRRP
jgi:hypothetical protein